MGLAFDASLLVLAAILGTGDGMRSGAKTQEPEGYVWHVNVLPDDYCSPNAIVAEDKAAAKDRVCAKNGGLKPRRGPPAVLLSELLAMTSQNSDGVALHGTINGWGALTDVKVRSVTCAPSVYLWREDNPTGNEKAALADVVRDAFADADFGRGCPKPLKSFRLRVTLPPWSSVGWSQTSPGFAWWYLAQDSNPRLIFGEDMLSLAGEGRATKAHMLTHRYAKEKESLEDKLTWHTAVVLEWHHGQHLTIVEVAWLNGVSGSSGKSPWYDDMDDPNGTALFKRTPERLIAPWNDKMSEIRISDVHAKSVSELGAYLIKYSNTGTLPQKEQRFKDPVFPWDHKSADVQLYRNTRGDIGRYVINWIRHDGSYNKRTRNCQTFAADLFTFLTGIKAGMKLPGIRSQNTNEFVQEPLAM